MSVKNEGLQGAETSRGADPVSSEGGIDPYRRPGLFYYFRRHRSGRIGAFIVGAFILMAVFAPFLYTYQEVVEINLTRVVAPPSAEHPLGTDQLGRDLLGRVIWGARSTLGISLASVLVGVLLGTVAGIVTGYYDGWASSLVTRGLDALLAFPRILLALFIIAVLGRGSLSLSVAIGLSAVPVFARVVRGAVIGVKEQAYIEAARALGATNGHIILKYVIPNVWSVVIVQASMNTGAAIVVASGLSFLGLGPAPPSPEWGVMVADGRSFLQRAPHVVLVPSLAVFFSVLGFNLLGDALRDVLDPRRRL